MSNQVIGKRIRILREEKQMSREELAAKAEISSKFLYEIENGKKGLSAGTLLKISRALSSSCDYILNGIHRADDEETEEYIYLNLYKKLTVKQQKLVNEVLTLILNGEGKK